MKNAKTDESEITLNQAMEIAFRRLDFTARSKKDVYETLRKRGVSEKMVEEVLERLEKLKFTDDKALAQGLVKAKFRSRGLVGSVLKQELKQKGIPDDITDAAAEQLDDQSITERCRELAQKKLNSLAASNFDYQTKLRRTVNLLLRKGYKMSLAIQITKTILNNEPLSD